jgi:hypothetical protein
MVFCVSERDCASRRLQDHQRIERGDAAVTIDVCDRVPATGGCEMERDCGVGGVEVAYDFFTKNRVKTALRVGLAIYFFVNENGA